MRRGIHDQQLVYLLLHGSFQNTNPACTSLCEASLIVLSFPMTPIAPGCLITPLLHALHARTYPRPYARLEMPSCFSFLSALEGKPSSITGSHAPTQTRLGASELSRRRPGKEPLTSQLRPESVLARCQRGKKLSIFSDYDYDMCP
jgi:hypothetical protein